MVHRMKTIEIQPKEMKEMEEILNMSQTIIPSSLSTKRTRENIENISDPSSSFPPLLSTTWTATAPLTGPKRVKATVSPDLVPRKRGRPRTRGVLKNTTKLAALAPAPYCFPMGLLPLLPKTEEHKEELLVQLEEDHDYGIIENVNAP